MTVEGVLIPPASNIRFLLIPPMVDAILLSQPIALPCGTTVPNRLVKVRPCSPETFRVPGLIESLGSYVRASV